MVISATRKHIKKKNTLFSNPLFLGCIIVIALSVVWPYVKPNLGYCLDYVRWNLYTTMKLSPEISEKFKFKFQPVPHIIWKSKNFTILKIISDKQPCIISNGPASNWSIDYWNLLDVQRDREIELTNARWQNEPIFILGRDREKGGMLGSAHDRPLVYTNITLGEFLNSVFDWNSYFYWTGQLSLFNSMEDRFNENRKKFSILQRSADWAVFNVLEEELKDSIDADDDSIWAPTVWLSHPGVVAQTHYDTQHNFFTQILGVKRVTLFPPRQEVYLYPNIHRSFRQSQARLERGGDALLFPELVSAETALQVDLHPGQTLYIPPNWFHRVESLTLALSISVPSPASDEAKFSEAYWHLLPIGAFRDPLHKQVAVTTYLRLLIGSVSIGRSFEEFVQRLYRHRYRPLQSQQHPDDLKASSSSNAKAFRCASSELSEAAIESFMQDHMANFTLAAKQVSSVIDSCDASPAVKEIFCGDYTEQLVRWAVGPAYVGLFLNTCIQPFETS